MNISPWSMTKAYSNHGRLILKSFLHYSRSCTAKLKLTKVETIQQQQALCSNKNFSFHQSQNSYLKRKQIVVMYAWLYCSKRHLDKYCNLYLNQGIDVLTVRVSLVDVIFPQMGCQRIALNTVRFLTENVTSNYHACWFHSFSVGTYQVAEVFQVLRQVEQARDKIQPLLKGLILDSPITAFTPTRTALSLALASSTNPNLQFLVFHGFKLYYSIFRYSIFEQYVSAFRTLDKHELKCPVLIFASKDDAIGDYEHFEQMAFQWTNEEVPVSVKFWDSSIHVSHYLKYPDEYTKCLDNFVKKTDL